MKDRVREIIEFAKKSGFSEEEFKCAIEEMYAAHADIILDADPSGVFEVKTTLAQGHAVIVQARREYLQ